MLFAILLRFYAKTGSYIHDVFLAALPELFHKELFIAAAIFGTALALFFVEAAYEERKHRHPRRARSS